MCRDGGKPNESSYTEFGARAGEVRGGIASFAGGEMALAHASRARPLDGLQSNGQRRDALRERRSVATRTAGFVLVLSAYRRYVACFSATDSASHDAFLLSNCRKVIISGKGASRTIRLR